MTDEEIDTSDIPELTSDFFARARLRMPTPVSVTVTIEPAVLKWYESLGEEESKRRMASALKIYAEIHKVPPPL